MGRSKIRMTAEEAKQSAEFSKVVISMAKESVPDLMGWIRVPTQEDLTAIVSYLN